MPSASTPTTDGDDAQTLGPSLTRFVHELAALLGESASSSR